jgi:Zn-dependent metalloprotease
MNIFSGNDKAEQAITGFGDKARFVIDTMTRIPKRIEAIDIYPERLKKGTISITRENIDTTFKEFFQEQKKVFAIEPDDLKLHSARKINNRWYVKYHQYYKGLPVLNASVGLDSTENGKVGTFAGNYYPDINVPIEPQVNLEKAAALAIGTYPEPVRSKLQSRNDQLIIYPQKGADQVLYRLAWKFLIVPEQPDPELEKYFIIDAIDGTIIESYNARFPGAQVSGSVKGEVYPVNPTDAISTVPLNHAYVVIQDAGQTTTDSSGNFQKTVSWIWSLLHPLANATSSLEGPYARVQDSAGANYTLTRNCSTSSSCNITWTAADRDHINVFYHMNRYHDWLQSELGYSWTNHWTGTSCFNARVNYTFDNAYAGNPMEFGSNNFARSSDVIYHECTHNVLVDIYGDWIGFPSTYSEAYAMDEGFADYFACSFTNESRHGEGYSAHPRNLDNTNLYPGKSSYASEGHSGGTIIAGAAWDFRQRLVSLYGSTGARIADQLVFEAHQILSTYPRNYYFSDPSESNLLTALYRAADVDNNLLNGFPYFNDIQHAFHRHALLQVILHNHNSFDFSTNTLGTLTGGDLYYSGGKFWANNVNQKGVKDLGNIGDVDLATVDIPTDGYTRFGVEAVSGHTYSSIAQEGEVGSYIMFRVKQLSADKSTVTLEYFYRFSPWWYIANDSSKEIHRLDCHWITLMAASNKVYCEDLQEVANLIEHNGYNGCHYCLPRYDTDTLSLQQVVNNLNEDLQ